MKVVPMHAQFEEDGGSVPAAVPVAETLGTVLSHHTGLASRASLMAVNGCAWAGIALDQRYTARAFLK
ncbi:hypothetical protein [Burkholderia stagnalis]